ncbi:hypothetical protein [Spongiactinospora sp. TRM90649]|uniref:hypothetical protein n=1 Tax=Spongiactinospora sp. TRM90649 TaxID=3031114 RepID=UPI0023F7F2BA|nr:hypothetical protein [Spongiactinospora sp. TRM90649]MDF5753030.1 hypothetical protein [Spongiactinospora sp. TRM90649]
MVEIGHILTGLRCAACGAMDTLWFDLARLLIECRECGTGALLDVGDEEVDE